MSLADALKANRNNVRKVETNDRSQPKTTEVVDIAAAEEYRRSVVSANIEQWLEPLGEHTFETQLIPLTEAEAIAIKLRFHAESGQSPDIPDTMNAEDIDHLITALQSRVQSAMDSMLEEVRAAGESPYSTNGVFIKMSSRSAKDSPLYSATLKSYYVEYMRREEDRSFNRKTQALLYAATQLLKVTQAQTAFEFFTKSERISEDIALALDERGDEFKMNIVLRKWVEIDIDMEFRGFYCNGQLNALSQYNHIVTFGRLAGHPEYQAKISQQIQHFFAQDIQPRLEAAHVGDCIVDFALTGADRQKCFIIELNPFEVSTDSGLFSWKQDRSILENGPFEFRVRETEDEDLRKRLGVDWRDVVDHTEI